MADCRRPIRFGYFLEPSAQDVATLVSAARTADGRGLDLLGVQDHPYQSRFVDTWTLLSYLGAVTERVALVPDVVNLPLRPPAVLAKSAASLDLLTGGRVELGLGAGAFWEPIAAMGGPRRTPGDAVTALREAIDILRIWWSGQRPARYSGRFYTLDGAHPGPPPAHDIGVWLGAYGPRTLAIVGSTADGWLPSLANLGPEKLTDAIARIDDAAQGAGRDPAAIDRVYNVWGDYSVAEWIDRLTEWSIEYGMNGYIFGGEPTERWLATIAEDIAPAVRERVDAARQ